MDLRDQDYGAAAEIASENECNYCARCDEPLSLEDELDGFECLACGHLVCRLCADDHAREAHPLPYEAEAAEQIATDDRARTRFMIAVSVAGMAGMAIALWPIRERFFALYHEPRTWVAMGILAGASIAIQIGQRRIGRRRAA